MANQYSKFKWEDERPFEDLGRVKQRNFLIKEANFSCSACGFNKSREDGRSILEIHHIDGNHQNNVRSNLKVLCPNCHAMTLKFRFYGKSHLSSKDHRARTINKELRIKRKLAREQRQSKIRDQFCETILLCHETKEIDFSKFGWVLRLSEMFGVTHQAIGRRIRKLMPEFYNDHCFKRKA
jgi:hypothetical protein